MKKVIICALVLCFLVSFASSASAGTKSIQNFDGYADLTAFQKDMTIWDGGANFTVKLSTTKKDSGTKSMQIIPVGESNGSTYGVILLQIPAASQNWEGAEGIQFWAKATGGTVTTPNYFSVQLMFDDCNDPENPERWATKEQMTYQTIDKDNKVTNKSLSGGVFTVDDGFEGIVKIPFESFAALGWSLVDDELQLGSIKTVYFGIDSKFYKSKELFIDTIQLYGADVGSSSSSSASSSSATSTTSSKVSSAASTGPTSAASSDSAGSLASEAGISSETLSGSDSTASEISSDTSSVQSEGASTVDTNSADSASTSSEGGDDGSLLPIIIIVAVVLVAAGAATYFLIIKRK